jgi:hypothetical protein
MVLEPNSEFFRYFNSSTGGVAPATPAQWTLTGQISLMHSLSC